MLNIRGSAGVNWHTISKFGARTQPLPFSNYTPRKTLFSVVSMSQIPATGSSSSNFRTIFYAAMKGYKKKTGKDLLEHPLMDQLQSCNSPADILSVLRGQVQQSTSGIDKWTKWLIPIVNVLYAFSGAIGE